MTLIKIFQFIVAILLILAILLQNKGTGLSGMLGGGGNVYMAKRGVDKILRTPELEENQAINNIFRNFKPVNHKRRRTYKKDL